MTYIQLNKTSIKSEHICCAFSDKKCAEGYQSKKEWLAAEFLNGYVFRRLDERAKVFMEYGPAETAWQPVRADNFMALGCFWVSGQYKKNGHAKALLESAIADAKSQGMSGLYSVVGTKKFHFMSDTRWFVKQGFEECDRLDCGFILLALCWDQAANLPSFKASVKKPLPKQKGVLVYYSNRCPYTKYHVEQALRDSCEKRGLPLQVKKLTTMQQAQSAPTPATIFSLYLDGNFVTTDISVCLDHRFDKITRFKP